MKNKIEILISFIIITTFLIKCRVSMVLWTISPAPDTRLLNYILDKSAGLVLAASQAPILILFIVQIDNFTETDISLCRVTLVLSFWRPSLTEYQYLYYNASKAKHYSHVWILAARTGIFFTLSTVIFTNQNLYNMRGRNIKTKIYLYTFLSFSSTGSLCQQLVAGSVRIVRIVNKLLRAITVWSFGRIFYKI